MNIPIYQVDAFASRVFSGNPAAVCLLDRWLDDGLLQSIAAENNLSETAFLVKNSGGFDLRWFTPVTEVDLCGHATLASAFVLFNCRGWPGDTVRFQTARSGILTVKKKQDGLLEMDFPSRPVYSMKPSPGLGAALGIHPREVFGSAEDLLVLVDGEEDVRRAEPDHAALGRLEWRGVIVTAPGDRSDFVSRFFAPRVGVPEDPVTGSAHCVLTPYWAAVLQKRSLHAVQVSKRGGDLWCRLSGERVFIAGRAVLYLEGTLVL